MSKTEIKQPTEVDKKLLEENTLLIGKDIFKKIKSAKSSFFERNFWSNKLMDLGMKDEGLKVQLFRFVDVLPTLKNEDQLSRHINEYFSDYEGEFSSLVQSLSKLGTGSFIGKFASKVAVKTGVIQMAKTFIAGENIKEVTAKIKSLRKNDMTFTIDILGEAVLSEKEAKHYQNLYLELIDKLSQESSKWDTNPLLETSPQGGLPKVNVSVKLSSIYSQVDSMDFDNSLQVLSEKLRPILKLAQEKNVFVYVDMEDYEMKDLTLRVFKNVLMEDEFKGIDNVGIVIQAYLKDSEKDLVDLIAWSKERGTPISVRLVKGAYWDYETIVAKQENWESPVFEFKNETDANYEKLTKLLIDSYPNINPAIASHNIRSLAHAKAYTELKELPKNAVEYQFLFGMADPIKEVFVNMGERVRVYCPYGELIPGMAYLVRRLLENTANESFLRQGFVEGKEEDVLLQDPSGITKPKNLRDSTTLNITGMKEFKNIPDTDFAMEENREKMEEALKSVRATLGKKFPLVIDGNKISTDEWCESLNPSRKDEIIGYAAIASEEDAASAVKAAKSAFKEWGSLRPKERAEYLFKAADIMLKRRYELAAIIVLEEGKPWREADGDVTEAIDFLNYYAIESVKMYEPKKLLSPSGEENYSTYKPKGVSVVISPWNFPLGILTGMSSASLACGNTVILKPANQASVIAAKYMEILIEAGFPPGVCNYLPGRGSVIGNYLVNHSDVNLIAFTGSMEVGLSINKKAAEVPTGQDFVKRVICEMGGKNAIIVDDDADLDEAVDGVIYSAFGYAGQKCSAASRVIVLKNIYERFIERLSEATKSIHIGEAEDPGSYLGPMIDEGALQNAKEYIEIGKKEGELFVGGDSHSDKGFYLNPTIFTKIKPEARIAQEEIFAPVLAVIKADDIDSAIEIANGVKYALTGGFYSRSPGNIQKIKEEFKVGNLYINRGCTGAKVSRQPFGGFKMSGIGSKAGGEDYLLQFVEPRVITENTMRRGFAPD